MLTQPRALGAHLYFFRNGAGYTVPSSGTCSKTSKPGAADTGWVDFGTLKDVQSEKQSQNIEIFGATPGQLRRTKVIETKKTLDLMFTCTDLSNLTLELAFGTGALASNATQANPLEGSEVEGWLKGQIYDHQDAQWIVFDLWVCIKAEGAVSLNSNDGQLNEVKLKAYGLHSSLNTLTLSAS